VEYVKWALIAIAAFLAFKWLSGALSSYNAQQSTAGWGSGMLYAPGSAYTQQPSSYAFGGQIPVYDNYQLPVRGIIANYTPDGGVGFQYGW
jgi:hypothetical protein